MYENMDYAYIAARYEEKPTLKLQAKLAIYAKNFIINLLFN